ncbi:MAG: DUF1579 domain-containing protein [Methanomicrobiales archaeon]|nr:DUF1579 domain-containing protein [Methanomicrobiales archaeon]
MAHEAKEKSGIPAWEPRVVKAGPEMQALARFFGNGTWTGTVMAGGMGPGSPEMHAKGSSVCKKILDDLWISCMFEQDQFIGGKKVITWKAHWVIGWDTMAHEYRAVGTDNNGVAFLFRGELDGDRLVMESMGEVPVKLRFTWDARDPKGVAWKNEMSVGGAPWSLIEEYIIRSA